MANGDAFSRLFQRARSQPGYWEGLVKMRFANDLGDLLERRQMSQAELARSIGKTPQYVSKVLAGDQNLTIGTMVNLLWVFNKVPRIEAVEQGAYYVSHGSTAYAPVDLVSAQATVTVSAGVRFLTTPLAVVDELDAWIHSGAKSTPARSERDAWLDVVRLGNSSLKGVGHGN